MRHIRFDVAPVAKKQQSFLTAVEIICVVGPGTLFWGCNVILMPFCPLTVCDLYRLYFDNYTSLCLGWTSLTGSLAHTHASTHSPYSFRGEDGECAQSNGSQHGLIQERR